jgi:hypothetical protein
VNTRLVAAFRGEVQCQRETGAVQWRLTGADRDGGGTLEVMLCGVAGPELPTRLADAELYVRGGPENPSWELRGGGAALVFSARAVQVHRDASSAFTRALPPILAPWTVRAGWVLLLDALRVPGVMRLLQKLRGGSAAP